MNVAQYLRCTWRTLILTGYLLAAAADMLLKRPRTLLERATWMQGWSKRILRYLHMEMRSLDSPDGAQAIVCNHLSYLDVLVLGAQRPTVFICKSEVRDWPLVGWLTAQSGAIFVDRKNPRSLIKAAASLEAALAAGVAVAFFPEATSTNGFTVLPFQPSLYAPLVRLGVPVWCAYLSYRVALNRNAVNEVRDRICYWGTANFARHIFAFSAMPATEARLRFALKPLQASDRKIAADMSHRMVLAIAISDQVPYAKGLEHLFNRPIEGIAMLRTQAIV